MSLVGFTGSRSLAPAYAPLVAQAVAAVQAGGRRVAVGCATGADAYARAAISGGLVFSAQAFGHLPAYAAPAARSQAMVLAVAQSGQGAALVGFVAAPCPRGLAPAPSGSRCFSGRGSGSWATLALGAGMGLPLVVFWCAPGAPQLPAWGGWAQAGHGPLWGQGWRLTPHHQAAFFLGLLS